jgi:hypothetical protein
MTESDFDKLYEMIKKTIHHYPGSEDFLFCIDKDTNEPYLVPKKIKLTKEFLSNKWIIGK